MPSEMLRPSTIEGIKSLARDIAKEQSVRHMKALELASHAAGFQNWPHAENVLKNSAKRSPLFLTAYWRIRNTDQRGRETLKVWLGKPWQELIKPRHFERHSAFFYFKDEGPDHLARRYLVDSQDEARRLLHYAYRVLQFIDATGLTPSKANGRAYPKGSAFNAIPGHSNSHVWHDRKLRTYLISEEPYTEAIQDRLSERAKWATIFNYDVVKPDWLGMSKPHGGTRLYLMSRRVNGIPLGPILDKVNALPQPLDESVWTGESAPTVPWFVSPGYIARAEQRAANPSKPRPKPKTKRGKRNSVGYVWTFIGRQSRPDGRMPLPMHEEVGKLLKSVYAATFYRKGVYNRVDAVRSELDEWVQREYDYDEMANEQFHGLYYHGPDETFARRVSTDERTRHIQSLHSARQLLTQHYPNSAPLRAILHRMDGAIKSLETWA